MSLEVQPTDLSSESDQTQEPQALRYFFMMLAESGSFNYGSISGAIGTALFREGEDWQQVKGADGRYHWQRVAPGSRLDPEAQKVFNTVTNIANTVGVPRDFLFQYYFAAKQDRPLMNDDSMRENILNTVDYLKKSGWGQTVLANNPNLTELEQQIQKLGNLNPDQFRQALATQDPKFDRLRELLLDPQTNALIVGIKARRMLEEQYGYSPENGRTLTVEQARDIGSQLYLEHVFTKDIAQRIRERDNTEDITPFFSADEIAANPALKDFLKKEFADKGLPAPSAHDLVQLARLKMDTDVSNLLQTAPTNLATPSNYNEIDREMIHDVSIGNLKTAVFGNESGGLRKPYEAVGPEIHGEHARGKYQVMDSNIASWTREALGKAMTSQEFINSPEAQEYVASFKLRQYVEMSNRLHGGHATQEQIVKDVASYWQSGTDFERAVEQGRNDRHWTTERYGNEAWNTYSQLPIDIAPMPQQIAGTDADNAIGRFLGARTDYYCNIPYHMGGDSLGPNGGGIDCSHFIINNTVAGAQQVNAKAGRQIIDVASIRAYLNHAGSNGRLSQGQYEALKGAGYSEYSRADIDSDRLAPGTLVFVYDGRSIDHVAQVSLDSNNQLQISQSGGGNGKGGLNQSVNNETYAEWMSQHAGARLAAINPFEIRDPALIAARDAAFGSGATPAVTANSSPTQPVRVATIGDLKNLFTGDKPASTVSAPSAPPTSPPPSTPTAAPTQTARTDTPAGAAPKTADEAHVPPMTVAQLKDVITDAVAQAMKEEREKEEEKKRQLAQVASEQGKDDKNQPSAGKHFDGSQKPKSAANDSKGKEVAANGQRRRHDQAMKSADSKRDLQTAASGSPHNPAPAATAAVKKPEVSVS